jgi:glycerol-3-phosphate acyltransferase PlsY
MALAPLVVWFFWPEPELIIMQVIMSLLLFWRHRENIRRIASGEEGRIKKEE